VAEIDTIKEFLGDSPVTESSVQVTSSSDSSSQNETLLQVREYLGDN
jgi:hypothetical protein